MKKHSIWCKIKDTSQGAVHNIELMLSIILGGTILIFLNYLNKINLISTTLPKLIGATVFLWAMLAFFIYLIILKRSHIIEFLREKYFWQFVGWFVLISLPSLLIDGLRINKNYIDLFIYLVISILFWSLFGIVIAALVNASLPLQLVIKQIKLIMVISFIFSIFFYLALIWVIATDNKLSLLAEIFNWTTWKLFLTYFAQGYWLLCIIMIFIWEIIWSILDALKKLFMELKNWSFNAKSKLKEIEQFLIDTLRINPLIVPIIKVLVIYFVLVSLAIILFDYLILFKPRIWESSWFLNFHESIAYILLTGGSILVSGLILVTIMYLSLPQELKRIRLENNIQKMILILFLLFILWWFLWTSVALNLEIFDQNTFAYTDGRTGIPKTLDFLFYFFALMTSAGYGELKPLSLGAHILVMLVTSTGLALLVIFVGAALSFESKSSKYRKRRKM